MGNYKEAVTKALETYQKGDMDGLLAMCTENSEWWISGEEARIPWAGRHRGKHAIKHHFALVSARYSYMSDMKIDIISEDPVKRMVTVQGSWTAMFRTPSGRLDSQHPVKLPFAMVWEFTDDGLIKRYWNYRDSYIIAQGLAQALRSAAAARPSNPHAVVGSAPASPKQPPTVNPANRGFDEVNGKQVTTDQPSVTDKANAVSSPSDASDASPSV